MERNCFRCEVRGKRKFLWHWPQLSLNMVSLSLNSLKQIMKAMVDHQGFDKVLRKVRLSHSETLFDAFNIYFCDREHRGTARLPGRDVTQVHCWQVATYAPPPSQVDVLSATPGKVVCEMRVEEEHTNRGGTLHGGLTATLVDVISTMAIMYTERGAPGVSVDMNITWAQQHGQHWKAHHRKP